MRKEYDFKGGVRGKYCKQLDRMRFHEMSKDVREEIAARALPFINGAMLAQAELFSMEMEATMVLGSNNGVAELIHRQAIKQIGEGNSKPALTVKELAKEIHWWEASDDEYFAAQEKAEKKKKKK